VQRLKDATEVTTRDLGAVAIFRNSLPEPYALHFEAGAKREA